MWKQLINKRKIANFHSLKDTKGVSTEKMRYRVLVSYKK